MTAPLRSGEPIVVDVALGNRAYDIVIGRGVLSSLGARALDLGKISVQRRRSLRMVFSAEPLLYVAIADEKRAIIGGAIAAFTTILLLAGLLLGVGYLWLFGDDLWAGWAAKGFYLLVYSAPKSIDAAQRKAFRAMVAGFKPKL